MRIQRDLSLRAVEGRNLIITEEHVLHPRRNTLTLLKARARLFARHNIRNSEFGLSIVADVLAGAKKPYQVALM